MTKNTTVRTVSEFLVHVGFNKKSCEVSRPGAHALHHFHLDHSYRCHLSEKTGSTICSNYESLQSLKTLVGLLRLLQEPSVGAACSRFLKHQIHVWHTLALQFFSSDLLDAKVFMIRHLKALQKTCVLLPNFTTLIY